MTILLTDTGVGPTGLSAAQAAKLAKSNSAKAKTIKGEIAQAKAAASGASGLIMLLHINADNKAGGVVSIPPQTVVNVPGHGKMQIQNVIAVGGPSLLVKTLETVTGLPINHYTRVDFSHVSAMIKAEGGVSVTLPKAEVSFGHHFTKGVNQINGAEALDYARAQGLTEAARVLRQQSLTRAVLSKLGNKHLLINPLSATRVLNALTSMLTVDSSLTNSQVEGLATDLGHLTGNESTYVTAPTKTIHGSVVFQPAEAGALWSSVNSGSIAAFAKKYPKAVTPAAP
jgi:LCP family protein required for cell wall assembly